MEEEMTEKCQDLNILLMIKELIGLENKLKNIVQ